MVTGSEVSTRCAVSIAAVASNTTSIIDERDLLIAHLVLDAMAGSAVRS